VKVDVDRTLLVMPGAIHSVILKIAARCNLNCTYCYVYNHGDTSFLHRPKFIEDGVYERTLEIMAEYCVRHDPHRMSITFHGGEPTLIGAKRFDKLAKRAGDVLGSYLGGLSIQTNATLLTDAWIAVLKNNNIQVGISLDGPAAINDLCRLDRRGRGSYQSVVEGLDRLRSADIEPGLLCVINPRVSGLEIFKHFLDLGFKRMNFLLPDATHDSKHKLYGSEVATPVADYLIPIFDYWFELDDPSIRISLFRDLLRKLMGGNPETDAFGSANMGYIVVETDGSIEALDVLRVCEEGMGRSGLNVLDNNFDDLRFALPTVNQAIYDGFPLPGVCEGCSERDICGGGYLPHRYSRDRQFDNASVWCADILRLLSHIRDQLASRIVEAALTPPRGNDRSGVSNNGKKAGASRSEGASRAMQVSVTK
jgi:uncharacterized protein